MTNCKVAYTKFFNIEKLNTLELRSVEYHNFQQDKAGAVGEAQDFFIDKKNMFIRITESDLYFNIFIYPKIKNLDIIFEDSKVAKDKITPGYHITRNRKKYYHINTDLIIDKFLDF